MDFGGDLDRLIRLLEGAAITRHEFLDAVLTHLSAFPEHKDAVLSAISSHLNEEVREVAPRIREVFRRRSEQIKDIDENRRNSPLRPGTRLVLSGGYTSGAQRPWWLQFRENYKATFIDFRAMGTGNMPVAIVELDDEIDMVEGGGLHHVGRYALLKLWHVANWAERETVTVHIVQALPDDVEAFYVFHPFGTEIESHATYMIAENEVVA